MPQPPVTQTSTLLTTATAKHIAPIFQANPVEVMFQGTSEQMVNQGTMTFISYKGHCFGITNQHVTKDFARVTADTAFMVALRRHDPVPGRLIFSSLQSDFDSPFDVAVFILNEAVVRAGGKIPAPIVHSMSPVVEGKKYMALGYPGHLRGRVEDKTSHPIYHIVATCQLISDRKIVLQDDLPPASHQMQFGGISGGAILNVESDNRYSIVGIVFEGRGQHEDVEQKSGASDIWIYGIPLTTTWMDSVLLDAQNRNVSLDVVPLQLNLKMEIDDASI